MAYDMDEDEVKLEQIGKDIDKYGKALDAAMYALMNNTNPALTRRLINEFNVQKEEYEKRVASKLPILERIEKENE